MSTHALLRGSCLSLRLQSHSANVAAFGVRNPVVQWRFVGSRQLQSRLALSPTFPRWFSRNPLSPACRNLHSSLVRRRADDTDDNLKKDENQLSLREKLTLMTREYGKITIGVYLVYDAISFGCFFAAIKMGVDINALLNKVGLDLSHYQWAQSDASTAVIAYAAHKVFAPIRIFLTIGSTPYIVRTARHWGWMKENTPSSSEVREELSEKSEEYMDHYKERAEEWLETFKSQNKRDDEKKP